MLRQLLLEETSRYVPASVEDALYMERAQVTIAITHEWADGTELLILVTPNSQNFRGEAILVQGVKGVR
jgi:hypothetical protein